MDEPNPILCQVLRGERVESVHRGSWVLVGPEGTIAGRGRWDLPTLPRSSLKPLQLLPLFASGEPARLGLTPEEQAVLVASHSGDERHVAAVHSVLTKAGLDEAWLGCGAHDPFDHEATVRLYCGGGRPARVHNNCSGKHSGMLLRARMLGAPLEGYLDPAHPVQVEIREAIAEVCGVEVRAEEAVIDGCGAPMYPMPLDALARAFRDLANPDRLAPRWRDGAAAIVAAVNAAPHYLAGRGRFDTALLEARPGRFLAKGGAEGCFALGARAAAAGIPLGLMVKIDDGNKRGYECLVPGLLAEQGLLDGTEAVLAPFRDSLIMNTQGLVVGRLRPILDADPDPDR
ncbi:MAG: asparaginase [Planctomycetota bacterium]